MAMHSVADLLPKGVQSVRLGKDRLTQSAGGKTAFHCFLDQENDFVHVLQLKTPLDSARFTVNSQERFRITRHSSLITSVSDSTIQRCNGCAATARLSITWRQPDICRKSAFYPDPTVESSARLITHHTSSFLLLNSSFPSSAFFLSHVLLTSDFLVYSTG